MQQSYGDQSKAKLIGGIVAVLVVAGVVLLADHLKAKTVANGVGTAQVLPTGGTTSSASTAGSTNPTGTSSTTSSYKDGTYSAGSAYYVPHSQEEIKVTLTIKDGVITDSSIINSEGDRDSAAYQQEFEFGYKSQVVGKSISGLSLSRISGASDTTQGFNDALAQIANQAKA
ncbi:MAG: hypothetical protein JWN82_534 [Candidatus Saccharibacteria bacterium]|nr:hypothetical protein [Candidatus Saccharibacteria bacterium]